MKTFESIDLFAPLQRALAEQNYITPTPIQAETIPPAVDGRDILGCAQTGTGKTAAFALPILDFIGHEQPPVEPNRPTALVLAPTRELAIQISESFGVYGKHVRFRQALVYGGVRQEKQVQALRRGVDVVIATPGRLLDLMQQGHIDLCNIQIFVLDEADRMLDMGFLPELRKIIAKLPDQRQSLFFSATMPTKARELSSRLLYDPVSINVAPNSPTIDQVEQKVRMLSQGNKLESLRKLLSLESVDRTIVFTRTKRGANVVARKLEQTGIRTAAIHGNKTQNARQKALEAFRRNQVTVLVATDVAARGIDIDKVTHVVNYDMPDEPESYIHRIGRTGRAGEGGVAILFCTPGEHAELRAIEKLVGKRLIIEKSHGLSKASPAANTNRRPKSTRKFRTKTKDRVRVGNRQSRRRGNEIRSNSGTRCVAG